MGNGEYLGILQQQVAIRRHLIAIHLAAMVHRLEVVRAIARSQLRQTSIPPGYGSALDMWHGEHCTKYDIAPFKRMMHLNIYIPAFVVSLYHSTMFLEAASVFELSPGQCPAETRPEISPWRAL
jgi:hypothetical protein